ncbi:MAG TPA: FtsX-like permease family protein [Steroidobacteraceae bacterium]|jgi:putative ABC transport system permease protein
MGINTLLRTLWRTPAGPLLLAAQVALSLMIFANVAYVIYTRLETTARPTGMDVDNIFWISSQGYGKDYDQRSTIQLDLEYLNLLPGVIAASVSNAEPQSLDALHTQVSVAPGLKGAKMLALVYQTTDKVINTLGLQLLKGREFSRDAVLPPSSGSALKVNPFGPEVVITEDLATKLFGGSDQALGKPLYFSLSDGGSATIVGVVALLLAAPRFGLGWDFAYDVVLAPAIPGGSTAIYFVRTQPGRRDEVMAKVKKEFEALRPSRYIDEFETLTDTVSQRRAADRNGAMILAILSSFVLAVTMLGLFGFASFAVTSRTKEIGTRRAIGATRADIVKQFLTENLVITTSGIAVGSVMTLAFALQLSMLLELPRLPIIFLTGAMALIWMTGLIAALIPALRGASVPPAVATRAA